MIYRRARTLGIVPALLCAAALSAQAQPRAASAPVSPSPTGAAAKVEQGPSWSTLKPAQREALKPLERDWAGIDTLSKRKWIEIAERYPAMPAPDQARLQTRMAEWAKMTPQERSQVRLHFQEAKQLPPQDRQASWEAYKALPPAQRRELAERAAPVGSNASRPGDAKGRAAARTDALAREGTQTKANTVPDPALARPPKPVAPTVVQAQPGATTTLISKQPAPPAHQQTGMPKIAAAPEYVDKKTLLPQTGAQSATARPAPVPVPAPAPPARP